ncbi:hypothetical protein ATY78_02680 [Rhizobium sp. R635]|uniref:hypothetical protein n=1 Tax=Rhizobium sp. R635 TaxID=1764275 RepID=UPI000B53690C|nr:hypothetical protein [Rhizobium sp. R635]OWV92454.1 hypothetical protein ATY78_02680 [Rhizobium sp. R635]
MSLLKFFLKPALSLTSTDVADPPWKNDPLQHPEVERMSMREIADLPLGMPAAYGAETKPQLAKCA